ncbi:hypothetical protein ABBQ32_003770 [Trebouxia sp. C0010 RCD-2024]
MKSCHHDSTFFEQVLGGSQAGVGDRLYLTFPSDMLGWSMLKWHVLVSIRACSVPQLGMHGSSAYTHILLVQGQATIRLSRATYTKRNSFNTLHDGAPGMQVICRLEAQQSLRNIKLHGKSVKCIGALMVLVIKTEAIKAWCYRLPVAYSCICMLAL